MRSICGNRQLRGEAVERAYRVAVVAASCFLFLTSGMAQPRFNSSGPEADLFGAAKKFPVGDRHTWRETPFLVGSFSRFDSIFPVNLVPRAATPWQFTRAKEEPAIRYEFKGGTHTLDAYLARFPVTGILLLQGDTILLERYQYGRTDADRFMSASISKSILSLITGLALGDGKLRSLEDKAARYVPELAGRPYGDTTLRALLQMSSGVEFDGKVNGVKSDANTQRLIDGMFSPDANPIALLAAAPRVHPERTHFDYSAGDNETLGIVLRRATGKSLSAYFAEKLWQPIGAEADATWWVDTSGQELPAMGFSATVRDYARLGRLLAHEGVWNGRQVVPKDFLRDATTHHAADRHLAPGTVTPYYGYGFQFWIFPGERRMFVLRGMNSQYVFVDPASKLVLVQAAVRSEGPNSENGDSECMALWLALVKQFALDRAP